MTSQWTHDALQADLATHLHCGGGRIIFTNIVMGEAGAPRPDVLAMAAYAWALELTAFEIKISVADYRSDITSGKWQKYLGFAQAVTFAVPAGMITLRDLPDRCGLIERNATGWRHRRKPTMQALDLSQKHMLKLMRTSPFHPRSGHMVDANGYIAWQKQTMDRETQAAVRHAEHQAGQKLGKAIAIYLRDVSAAEGVVKRAQDDARKIIDRAQEEATHARAEARREMDEVAKALGLEPGLNVFDLNRQVRHACRRLSKDGEVIHLRQQLGAIEDAIKDATPIGESPTGRKARRTGT